MAATKQITVYVIQRLSWEYGDDFYYRNEENDAPMKTFRSRDTAETYRREMEWRHVLAEKINPFGYVDLPIEERSSLPYPEYLAGLREAGINVESINEQDYPNFWSQYDGLSDENKRKVWDLTDRLRFFELLEMQVELED